MYLIMMFASVESLCPVKAVESKKTCSNPTHDDYYNFRPLSICMEFTQAGYFHY